jgi:HSP20 family protein
MEFTMRLPSLWSGSAPADPFRTMRREMDDFFNDFARRWPTADVGIQAPAINVAETKEAIEVTAELPGVDQEDIKVSVDGNRLVISGEKKKESEQKEKDWHVMERSYGSFMRAISLPFEPRDDAIDAHFDNGVLRLNVKKPPSVQPATKTIEIKTGTPPSGAAPSKAA